MNIVNADSWLANANKINNLSENDYISLINSFPNFANATNEQRRQINNLLPTIYNNDQLYNDSFKSLSTKMNTNAQNISAINERLDKKRKIDANEIQNQEIRQEDLWQRLAQLQTRNDELSLYIENTKAINVELEEQARDIKLETDTKEAEIAVLKTKLENQENLASEINAALTQTVKTISERRQELINLNKEMDKMDLNTKQLNAKTLELIDYSAYARRQFEKINYETILTGFKTYANNPSSTNMFDGDENLINIKYENVMNEIVSQIDSISDENIKNVQTTKLIEVEKEMKEGYKAMYTKVLSAIQKYFVNSDLNAYLKTYDEIQTISESIKTLLQDGNRTNKHYMFNLDTIQELAFAIELKKKNNSDIETKDIDTYLFKPAKMLPEIVSFFENKTNLKTAADNLIPKIADPKLVIENFKTALRGLKINKDEIKKEPVASGSSNISKKTNIENFPKKQKFSPK